MKPKTVDKWTYDSYIPNCAYCADFTEWKDGYWVGESALGQNHRQRNF